MQKAVLASVETSTKNAISPSVQFVNNPIFTGKVYLEQWGDNSKPSIILIHGLGDDGIKDWRFLAPVLAKSFHVIAFDLPGFGRSGKDNELYSPDNYARLVDWLATHYARRPFTLIGHSMGGVIALSYATMYPGDLKQLILVDAVGILHPATFSKSLLDNYKPLWWMHLIPDTVELNKLLGFSIDDFYNAPQAIEIALSSPITRKIFLDANPSRIAGLAMTQKDFSGLLKRVTIPTLIVWGDNDGIAPLRTGQMLDFLLPNSRLVVIPNAKHEPMIDTTARFNQLILNAATIPQPPVTNSQTFDKYQHHKDEQCNNQDDVHYSGYYRRLVINNCHYVTIENAKINQLDITGSNVTITNSDIGGGKDALKVSASMIFATASKLHGIIPVHADDSRLDFAGVLITGRKQAFNSTTAFQITFSLCEVTSPQFTGYRHGVYKFLPGEGMVQE